MEVAVAAEQDLALTGSRVAEIESVATCQRGRHPFDQGRSRAVGLELLKRVFEFDMEH